MGGQRRKRRQARKRKAIKSETPPSATNPAWDGTLSSAGDAELGQPEAPRAGAGQPVEPRPRPKRAPVKGRPTTLVANELVLLGEKGYPVAFITSEERGTILMMCDDEGRPRLRLGVDKQGLPSLIFFAAARLDQAPGGEEARLKVECAPYPVDPTRVMPVISLFDPAGYPQASFVATPSGEGALTFYKSQGKSFAWSLDSDLGLTRYETKDPGQVDVALLWETEKLMHSVRRGNIADARSAARLLTIYERLVV